jgi:hypothetical protein
LTARVERGLLPQADHHGWVGLAAVRGQVGRDQAVGLGVNPR